MIRLALLALLLTGCAGTSRDRYNDWRIHQIEKKQALMTEYGKRVVAGDLSPEEALWLLRSHDNVRTMDSILQVGICRYRRGGRTFTWECKYPQEIRQ